MKQLKFISHRGNVTGPCPDSENTKDAIENVLTIGFDAEVDVWQINGRLYLGHDGPGEQVDPAFLTNPRIWCHAKNHAAFDFMRKADGRFHYFWHDTDAYTLTSQEQVWTYPGSPPLADSIYVMPEMLLKDAAALPKEMIAPTLLGIIGDSYAVCSDYVGYMRSYLGQ